MKVLLLLSSFLTLVCGQYLGPSSIAGLCGDLSGRECRSKGRRCITMLRPSTSFVSRTSIMDCMKKYNLTADDAASITPLLTSTVKGQGGASLLEDLSIDQVLTFDDVRRCIFTQNGIASDFGALSIEKLRSIFERKFRQNTEGYSPDVVNTMLKSMTGCLPSSVFADAEEVGNCLISACMKHIDSSS